MVAIAVVVFYYRRHSCLFSTNRKPPPSLINGINSLSSTVSSRVWCSLRGFFVFVAFSLSHCCYLHVGTHKTLFFGLLSSPVYFADFSASCTRVNRFSPTILAIIRVRLHRWSVYNRMFRVHKSPSSSRSYRGTLELSSSPYIRTSDIPGRIRSYLLLLFCVSCNYLYYVQTQYIYFSIMCNSLFICVLYYIIIILLLSSILYLCTVHYQKISYAPIRTIAIHNNKIV